MAGRPLPALERALAGPASSHAPAPVRHLRQADKPGLFAVIRRDARDKGLSIRALADRHGVHRRTVRQALASPGPAPRKRPQRRSRLDPFKDTIEAILLSGPGTPQKPWRTVKQIFDYVAAERQMTGVSYATVRDYVASRRLPQQPGSPHRDNGSHDAQLVITHLKGLLKTMDSGIAGEAQPHLDALELMIKQAQATPGEEQPGHRSRGMRHDH